MRYQPVAPDSFEFALSAEWGFPPFAVALGSSYFQRLLAALPQLAAAAARCPSLARYCPAAGVRGVERPSLGWVTLACALSRPALARAWPQVAPPRL